MPGLQKTDLTSAEVHARAQGQLLILINVFGWNGLVLPWGLSKIKVKHGGAQGPLTDDEKN